MESCWDRSRSERGGREQTIVCPRESARSNPRFPSSGAAPLREGGANPTTRVLAVVNLLEDDRSYNWALFRHCWG